jgi:hypothetical protein
MILHFCDPMISTRTHHELWCDDAACLFGVHRCVRRQPHRMSPGPGAEEAQRSLSLLRGGALTHDPQTATWAFECEQLPPAPPPPPPAWSQAVPPPSARAIGGGHMHSHDDIDGEEGAPSPRRWHASLTGPDGLRMHRGRAVPCAGAAGGEAAAAAAAWSAAAAAVSPFLKTWVGSPCLRHCLHGASIGGGGGRALVRGAPGDRAHVRRCGSQGRGGPERRTGGGELAPMSGGVHWIDRCAATFSRMSY